MDYMYSNNIENWEMLSKWIFEIWQMYLFKYNEISADTGLIQQQWEKSQLVLAYTSENLSYSCVVNFKKNYLL